MNADLRELATRQGMLQVCEPCLGRGWLARWHDGLQKLDSCTCPACVGGHRLPTEAEVRAAIFEAGWTVLVIHTDNACTHVEACRPSEQREGVAIVDEVDADGLMLLALLRAMKEVPPVSAMLPADAMPAIRHALRELPASALEPLKDTDRVQEAIDAVFDVEERLLAAHVPGRDEGEAGEGEAGG